MIQEAHLEAQNTKPNDVTAERVLEQKNEMRQSASVSVMS